MKPVTVPETVEAGAADLAPALHACLTPGLDLGPHEARPLASGVMLPVARAQLGGPHGEVDGRRRAA